MTQPATDQVRLDKPSTHVAVITLDNQARKNALSLDMGIELIEICADTQRFMLSHRSSPSIPLG